MLLINIYYNPNIFLSYYYYINYYTCIFKSFKPTIIAKIIRHTMRRIDRKSVFLYVNEICLPLEKNPKKNHVFVIILHSVSISTFCEMFLL